MSTKKTLLPILVGLIFCSCAPKDEKLIRPDSGGKIQVQATSLDETFNLASIVFDKQVEALYFLKVLLNPEYARQKRLNVEMISESQRQTIHKITSTDLKNENENYLQTSQVDLLAVVSRDESAHIQSILIKDDSAGQSTQELFLKIKGKLADKSNLIVTNKNKRILFTRENGKNLYRVEIDSIDALKTFNKKNPTEIYNDLSQITAEIVIAWDGKIEMLNEKIKIVAVTLSHVKTAQGKSQINMQSDGPTDLTVTLGECGAMDGEIILNNLVPRSDVKTEKLILHFEDSSLTAVGRLNSFKASECSHRPIVDLRKLL